jgi:hypothetical protein
MAHENQLDRQALRMEIKQRQCLQSLRADIEAGFEAVERGEYTDYDAASVKTVARRVNSRGMRRLAADSGRHSEQ